MPRTVDDNLCLDFVNSRYALHRTGEIEDRLAWPEWQRWFLQRCGFELDGEAPAPIDVLTRARGELRGLLEQWASGAVTPIDCVAALDPMVSAAAGNRRIVVAGGAPVVIFTPARRDWRWVLAEVAVSAADLARSGEAARLKVCGNPDCTWLFYDRSHNASRRWCDVATCGNLVKVREFRARRRAASG